MDLTQQLTDLELAAELLKRGVRQHQPVVLDEPLFEVVRQQIDALLQADELCIERV